MRILVADDDDDFAMPLTRELAQLGDVTRVHDGEAARAALLATPFDLALCEVNLPGLDGYRLLLEMRSMSPDTARRLVFYTSEAPSRAARAVRCIHVRPLLIKPITLVKIRAILADDPFLHR